jgi:predicted nuclease of predicted toxin-antitoxin system
MRFLLDQSTETRIATFLSSEGHDAKRVGRDYPPGLPDDQVLAIARSEQRILITNDRDFGELIFRRRLPHAGVILLRFDPATPVANKVAALSRLLITHADRLDQFIVVTARSVRVRSTDLSS